MRVLILGGTGFIGPWVVKRLLAEGHDVTLFHRGRTVHADLSDVPRLLGDRQQLAAHLPDFRRLAPDVVFGHAAARPG